MTAHARGTLANELAAFSLIHYETNRTISALDQTIRLLRKAKEFGSTRFSFGISCIVMLAYALLERGNRSRQMEDYKLANDELNLARELGDQA
jgi:hypothetical protein